MGPRSALIPPISALAPGLATYPVELQWVLARAFGTPCSANGGPARGAAGVTLARGLLLGARIAARAGEGELKLELGEEGARAFAFERLRLLATDRELTEARRRVSEAASHLGIRPLWLKFAALTARGFTTAGFREARDIDLLLPKSEGDRLYAALLGRDFRPAGPTRTPHQLPPLLAPSGAAVEIHRFVWGLRLVPERGDATFEDFAARGAVVTLSDGSLAPRDELLIAHALVHALAQHRGHPEHYAPFRVLADLVDLEAWRTPRSLVHAAVSAHLTEDEISCALSLSRELAGGTPASRLPGRERTLLECLLAASLDVDFQRALGLQRLGELVRQRRLLPTIWSKWRASPTSAATSGLAHEGGGVLQLAAGLGGYTRLVWRKSRFGA